METRILIFVRNLQEMFQSELTPLDCPTSVALKSGCCVPSAED